MHTLVVDVYTQQLMHTLACAVPVHMLYICCTAAGITAAAVTEKQVQGGRGHQN
jgi:hypothetical protein